MTFSQDNLTFVDPANPCKWLLEDDFGELSPDDEGERTDLRPTKDGQPPTKKTKSAAKSYKLTRRFQTIWSATLPRVKGVLSDDGLLYMVKCIVCSTIWKKKLIMAPK
ncbi:hypothetical protein KC19_VG239000 [Ceratodon purpureus]|uniref:Uncharacterized protein n=1 Tax=Ceratodon purpureus TaxID=3225 RepID=A0A8T0HTN9_CERPU|nr:hypothetical protein KC19_VG239000 [Ceratodon purpureus]